MSEQHNLRRTLASLLVLSLLLPTGSTISTGFVLGSAAAATTSTSQVYTLTFQGYDYNNKGEVSVLVNNQVVATLPSSYSPQNAKVFISVTLDISKYVVSGANAITFRQNIYSSGVKNVQVTGPTGVLLSDSTYHDIWVGGTSSVSYSFTVSQATTTTTTTNTTAVPASTTTTQTTTSTSTTTTTAVTSTTTTTSQSGVQVTAYAVDVVNGGLVDTSTGGRFTMVGLNYGDIPENFISGNYATDALNIKSAGFNTVKLVKEWGSLETSASPSVFTYDSAAMQNMMDQINALTQQGINVVVKIHADSDTASHAQNLNNFLGSQYCAPANSYASDFSTNFYTTSILTDGTTGAAHLTNLLLKISQLTRSNPRVIGFDVMNEPTYCSYTSSTVSSSIRTGWHQRIAEIAQALRSNGDNRIIIAEEAPMFEYYSNFVSFNDPKIISSVHWYRAEYKTSSGTWAACWADLATLQGYWGSTGRTGSQCSSVPLQIAQAQQKYPNQLFEVGEFGNIYGNTAGGLDDQWIQNSIKLFQAQNVVGIIYWSSSTTGTWIKDLTTTATTTTTTSTTTTTTTATAAASFKFVVMGDSRGNSASQPVNTDVLSQLSNTANSFNPAFQLFTGDLCYDFSQSNCPSVWKSIVNSNLVTKTVPVMGNHDAGDTALWLSSFNIRAIVASFGGTNYNYRPGQDGLDFSFDYGNSHFVGMTVINDVSSTRPSADQLNWLDADLTTAERTGCGGTGCILTFLEWHAPVYCDSDSHCSPPAIPPAQWTTITNAHPSIMAVFHGHEHITAYAHIDSSRISGVNTNRAYEEFIVGAAGAPLYGCLSRADWCTPNYGFALVTVSGSTVTVQIYDQTGAPMHAAWTFNKNPSATTLLMTSNTSSTTSSIGLAPNTSNTTFSTLLLSPLTSTSTAQVYSKEEKTPINSWTA
ncbi:MAG: cellulase family glycosylhydrolase [Thaumarchaeota archaeon]|nr:cellulase family glycosylhydrolase [Nitrososphaerota archaeon]